MILPYLFLYSSVGGHNFSSVSMDNPYFGSMFVLTGSNIRAVNKISTPRFSGFYQMSVRFLFWRTSFSVEPRTHCNTYFSVSGAGVGDIICDGLYDVIFGGLDPVDALTGGGLVGHTIAPSLIPSARPVDTTRGHSGAHNFSIRALVRLSPPRCPVSPHRCQCRNTSADSVSISGSVRRAVCDSVKIFSTLTPHLTCTLTTRVQSIKPTATPVDSSTRVPVARPTVVPLRE
jgi:hypothetical protein